MNDPFASSPTRTALAHHWLMSMRGGEKVTEQFCLLFPGAPIYTLIRGFLPLSQAYEGHELRQSFIGHMPGGKRHYKNLLPLFPAALKNLKVAPEINFILSCDASMIKAVNFSKEVPHVCYCCSPPRYLFDLQDQYLENVSGIKNLKKYGARAFTPWLKKVDVAAAQRVTQFITLSRFVEERIQRIYGRPSTIIYPPVAVADFSFERPSEDFYLVVSELVPYKRIDLAVEAFNRLGKKLVVIGGGSEEEDLRRKARSNITFLGRQPFSVLKDHFERCRAFVFAGIEDFGITVLEAQAAGHAVLAYRDGGAMETILEGQTGLFFDAQTPESLIDCVERFEKDPDRFTPAGCRANAERFRPERFRNEIKTFLAENFPEHFRDYPWPC